MTENAACVKAVKKDRGTENAELHFTPPGAVCEYLSYLLQFFLLRVAIVFVHGKATTLSFAACCSGSHYHNPLSEPVLLYPFVPSVLMTGNQMDVDKSGPRAAPTPPPFPSHNTYNAHCFAKLLP